MSNKFGVIRVGQYVLETYNGKIAVYCSNHECPIESVEEIVDFNCDVDCRYQVFHNVLKEDAGGEIAHMLIPLPLDVDTPEVVEIIEKYRHMLETGECSEGSPDEYPMLDIITSTEKLVLISPS